MQGDVVETEERYDPVAQDVGTHIPLALNDLLVTATYTSSNRRHLFAWTLHGERGHNKSLCSREDKTVHERNQ